MIYFDNGATSFPKPKAMIERMEECILKYCGNPGRSGHKMSMITGEEVYQVRKKLSNFFNCEEGERIIYTKNTTEGLNMAIKGVLNRGDHVVSTSMEHNSVLRPLKQLERKAISHTLLKCSKEGTLSPEKLENAIRPNTRLVIVTAASNVTGTIMPIREIGEITRKRGILFLVDGAQGAGHFNIDVQKDKIDMLAIAGHKGLLGPQGTGALYVRKGIDINPLLAGGTGTESKSIIQPKDFPEGLEAGTINAPGIIGWGCSLDFINKVGLDTINQYERELIEYLDNNLNEIPFVKIYGPGVGEKTAITLFNIEGISSEEVANTLSSKYDIAVRGGYHCAALAHRTIGTDRGGGVRVSLGPYNTKKQIDRLLEAVFEIGKARR